MSDSFLQFCDKCIYKKTSNEGNAIVEICNNKDSRFYGLTAEQIFICDEAKLTDEDDCEFYKNNVINYDIIKELKEKDKIIDEMLMIFEKEVVEGFLKCNIYISSKEGKKDFMKYYSNKLSKIKMESM